MDFDTLLSRWNSIKTYYVDTDFRLTQPIVLPEKTFPVGSSVGDVYEWFEAQNPEFQVVKALGGWYSAERRGKA